MSKKSLREQNYGKYIFRRKRNDVVQLFARVGYYDENGQWKYKYEKAEDEDDAKIKAKKIIETYKKRGTAFIDGSNMTFEYFADWYKDRYAIAPTYEEGQQVAGLRTYKNVRLQLDRLKLEFTKKKISRINEEVLHQFANKRKNIDKVKTATINRDLELLRGMFVKAVKQGWLEESPFTRSENLIRKSLEVRRKVTTSTEEERLVLDFTKRSENKYLHPLILALRDTGARPSELFPYSAYGVDLKDLPKKIVLWLENGINSDDQVFLPLCWFQLFEVKFQVMPLASLKSRQIEFRYGTMTNRLREALLNLWATTNKDPIQLVFPFKTIKKEWQKVRDYMALHQVFSELQMLDDEKKENFLQEVFGKKGLELIPLISESVETLISEANKNQIVLISDNSKIADLRIRDWRRIWRSKADLAGVPEQTAQRILGHKLLQTTYHYNEADLQAVVEAGRKMDELNLITEEIN